MFEFNSEMGEVVRLDFDLNLLKCMLQFIYTNKTAIDSEHLIDLLDLSHQYLLPKLKLAIETVLISNLNIETYLDTYMVAKAFDCATIHQELITFGISNV